MGPNGEERAARNIHDYLRTSAFVGRCIIDLTTGGDGILMLGMGPVETDYSNRINGLDPRSESRHVIRFAVVGSFDVTQKTVHNETSRRLRNRQTTSTAT